MSALVLDTHALLWYWNDPGKLSAAATALHLNLALVTIDAQIRESDIKTIW